MALDGWTVQIGHARDHTRSVHSASVTRLTYLTIGFFVNAAPCALISKTKTNQSQVWGVTLLNVLYSSLPHV